MPHDVKPTAGAPQDAIIDAAPLHAEITGTGPAPALLKSFGRLASVPRLPRPGAAAWGAQGAELPSGPPEARTRDVVGPDNRQAVPDVRQQPRCRICHLVMRDANNQSFSGTGWLAGPSTVFTAAHNLRQASQGYSAVRVWVRDNSVAPFGYLEATAFEVHPEWAVSEPAGADVGVIWLSQPLGDRLGWFGFTPHPQAVLEHLTVRVSGYPEDKPAGSQWFDHGPIQRVGAQMLAYGIDTMRGQSGSPVFHGDAQGQPVAVGVHVYGEAAQNLGVRITPAIFDTMRDWWR